MEKLTNEMANEEKNIWQQQQCGKDYERGKKKIYIENTRNDCVQFTFWCYGWEYEISLSLCVNSFEHTSNHSCSVSLECAFFLLIHLFYFFFDCDLNTHVNSKIKSNVVPLKLYPVPLWLASLLLINDHSNSMNLERNEPMQCVF